MAIELIEEKMIPILLMILVLISFFSFASYLIGFFLGRRKGEQEQRDINQFLFNDYERWLDGEKQFRLKQKEDYEHLLQAQDVDIKECFKQVEKFKELLDNSEKLAGLWHDRVRECEAHIQNCHLCGSTNFLSPPPSSAKPH